MGFAGNMPAAEIIKGVIAIMTEIYGDDSSVWRGFEAAKEYYLFLGVTPQVMIGRSMGEIEPLKRITHLVMDYPHIMECTKPEYAERTYVIALGFTYNDLTEEEIKQINRSNAYMEKFHRRSRKKNRRI